MITPELIQYISTAKTNGKSVEEIKGILISQGWNNSDIDQAIAQQLGNQEALNTSSQSNELKFYHPKNEKKSGIFDFKNMKWYEWVVILPAFFLLVQGGALGGAFGAIGWNLSIKIVRNESHGKVFKILSLIAVTALYYAIYFLIAFVIAGLIEGT